LTWQIWFGYIQRLLWEKKCWPYPAPNVDFFNLKKGQFFLQQIPAGSQNIK
jgi:hypothetical protein